MQPSEASRPLSHSFYDTFFGTRKRTIGWTIALVVVLTIIYWDRIQTLVEPPAKPTAIVHIAGGKDDKRLGDVVFVHGLQGGARKTWSGDDPKFFWPEELQKDHPDIGVWSIDYDSSPSRWLGTTMPLTDRSRNLLEELRTSEIGTKKPVIFVCHSLGGIVVKKMIQDTVSHKTWGEMTGQIKGVVFLATPHSGSGKADLLNLIIHYAPGRKTVTVDELQANSAILREVNLWYRDNAPDRDIQTRVLHESRGYPVIGLIVDESSSDPGLKDSLPIPVSGATHTSICVPPTKENLVYKSVSEFIKLYLKPNYQPTSISFEDFSREFEEKRNDHIKLETFKQLNARNLFIWEGYVINVIAPVAKNKPGYIIGLTPDPNGRDAILASFTKDNSGFDLSVKIPTRVRFSGAFGDATSSRGIVLKDCKVLEWLSNNEK